MAVRGRRPGRFYVSQSECDLIQCDARCRLHDFVSDNVMFVALQCVPFWPMQTDKKKTMMVKYKDDEKISEPFSFVDPHTTLVKLDNKVSMTSST